MPTSLKIALFEDTPESQQVILVALQKHLGNTGNAVLFQHTLFNETPEDQTRTYEDRLIKILKNEPFKGATLIVADRDLSKTVAGNFTGLSVSAVATAAKQLSIPLCSYARGIDTEGDWRGRWEEGHIALHLSEGEDELGRRAALAAHGFAEISKNLPQHMENKNLNSPAKLLSALLGKPEYADKIALYAVGDQNRLPHIPKEGKQATDQAQRLTLFLGYWLWDSLLRYPGIFVNEVAAASHLNILTNDFQNSQIRELFEAALYSGPFADTKKPQWWRGALDDVLSSNDCSDGLQLAQKRGFQSVRASECSVDHTKRAGYYCIISREPVSLENSQGGLSWFPRGADLTRISNPKFEEYGPWLGT
jgi:hypothetical protein